MADRDREEMRITRESGSAGGYAPAATLPAALTDRVRWGAIWAGVLVAVAAQIVLGVLGLALGLYAVGTTAGLWNALWALIALFLGGYIASRLGGVPTAALGAWHGVVVWALVLALGVLLTGIGAAGVASALPAGVLTQPNIAPETVISTAWAFFIGALLGLAAAIFGGVVGRRPEMTETRAT